VIYYVGILDGADDVWGVRIPDCPGCHGGGATPEAAISDAISALREWAAEMRVDGVEVPAARTATEILADPENRPDFAAGESAVLIPLMLDAGRTVRAHVTFDAGLLEAIDAEDAEDSRAPPFWPALLARRSRHGIERLHTIGCLQNSFGNCALAGTKAQSPRDGFGQKIFGVPGGSKTAARGTRRAGERSAAGRAAICSRVTSSTKPTAIGSLMNSAGDGVP
jgi:predicted RNase H-like HicB family nuclease